MTHPPQGRLHKLQMQYGHDIISVTIVRREGDRLTLTVETDGVVHAVAPAVATSAEVQRAVERRLTWIAKQRRFFEQFKPLLPSPQYVSGETITYLGRQYRLKVRKQKQQSVRLVGRYLHVGIPTPDEEGQVKGLVRQWYRLHADRVLRRRMGEADRIVKLLSLKPPVVVIRPMLRRWGSCTPRGRVTLNEDLVRVSLPCIDYVVAH
jgi:predicted metal-dependent hydrolase